MMLNKLNDNKSFVPQKVLACWDYIYKGALRPTSHLKLLASAKEGITDGASSNSTTIVIVNNKVVLSEKVFNIVGCKML